MWRLLRPKSVSEFKLHTIHRVVFPTKWSHSLVCFGKTLWKWAGGERSNHYNALLKEGNENSVGVVLKANTTRLINLFLISALSFIH